MDQHTASLRLLLGLTRDLGWYYLPVYGSTRPREAKRPVIEEVPHWPTMSSRDPQQIAAWVSGTGYGLALDCGRSNVVVLDADRPERAGGWDLREAWRFRGHPQRMSFIFDQPEERIGCGSGGWGAGDIRGDGGYVLMPPSFHIVGGAYRWLSRAGSRVMPEAVRLRLQAGLPEGAPVLGAPLPPYYLTGGEPCRVIREVGRRYSSAFADPVGSRHDLMRNAATEIMRLGGQGHQGSRSALEVLRISYLLSCKGDRQRELDAGYDFVRILNDRPRFLGVLTPEECGGAACV